MDLQRSYDKGFRKRAAAYGIDPDVLVKVADDGFLDNIVSEYKKLDPSVRRALIGGLITGLGSYAVSDYNPYDSWHKYKKGLIGGVAGGLATYGLDRAGVIDKLIPALSRR